MNEILIYAVWVALIMSVIMSSILIYYADGFLKSMKANYIILFSFDRLLSKKYELIMKIRNFHPQVPVETVNSALEELDKVDREIKDLFAALGK
jgi:tryptophan-rich sensory protein